MNSLIHTSCRASLRKTSRNIAIPSVHTYSSSPAPIPNPSQEPTPPAPQPKTQLFDITTFLSKPSWSIRSLLPPPNTPLKEEISPQQLHHLLRLSALPLPKSPEEETQMLKTLHMQLHFVRDIQSVDTEGIEPLQSIRDETREGIEEVTVSLKSLEGALGEEGVGRRNRRPIRGLKGRRALRERGVGRREGPLVRVRGEGRKWDVMATAGDKVVTPNGSYFVVRGGKGEVPVKAEN